MVELQCKCWKVSEIWFFYGTYQYLLHLKFPVCLLSLCGRRHPTGDDDTFWGHPGSIRPVRTIYKRELQQHWPPPAVQPAAGAGAVRVEHGPGRGGGLAGCLHLCERPQHRRRQTGLQDQGPVPQGDQIFNYFLFYSLTVYGLVRNTRTGKSNIDSV